MRYREVVYPENIELAKSANSKAVGIGNGKDGLPLILGNN